MMTWDILDIVLQFLMILIAVVWYNHIVLLYNEVRSTKADKHFTYHISIIVSASIVLLTNYLFAR